MDLDYHVREALTSLATATMLLLAHAALWLVIFALVIL